MKWIINFFSSGIGKKLLMSLTGLFLILFLVVHLVGNLQLLKSDDGESFNVYTKFMTHNPLIKFISYANYFFILLHAFVGIAITIHNKASKGKKNAVKYQNSRVSWAAQNMPLLGTLILAFILIHMGDFWLKMKTGGLQMVTYAGHDGEYKDLFTRVDMAFSELWIVAVYVIGMVVLALHLSHGFQSAFNTLGINNRKYTPIIKKLGLWYSILIPLGFAIIPLYYYFIK